MIAVDAPRAILVTGLFPDVVGLRATMRVLRTAGTTPDVIGLAIPVHGNPATAAGLSSIEIPHTPRPRFDVMGFLMTVLDPHDPGPDVRTFKSGQNSVLAQPFLSDLWTWMHGVKIIRVPLPEAGPEEGWMLGRPNHAASVAGGGGHASSGGLAGALTVFGVPMQHVDAVAAGLAAGQCLLTTCETDEGRTKRDGQIMRRNGATVLVDVPVYLERIGHSR